MTEYENVGPKMAVTVDGKVIFFDQKGNRITDLKKMNEEKFIDLINNNELRNVQTISVYTFGPGSDCKIVYTYYGVRYCFWVDCMTSEYKRPCGPNE